MRYSFSPNVSAIVFSGNTALYILFAREGEQNYSGYTVNNEMVAKKMKSYYGTSRDHEREREREKMREIQVKEEK